MKKFVAALALSLLVLAQPAHAQSILRDAETEAMFADMSQPLILAAGLSPKDVRVILINDESINAFVVGGQTVYVHSGLVNAADNANQVQGVIAHELGHIADGHVLLQAEGVRPALGIMLLSMVLGVAAIAAGSAEGGAGIIAAGQQVAQSKFLAFTRVQEATADATAAKFLETAGVSGKGFLQFFKKLQSLEYRAGYTNIDPFAQSHPLSGQRVATLTETLAQSPAWNKPFDPALEIRFQRVRAKLIGFVGDPPRTLNAYPAENQSIYAHYARAYAYHKAGYPEKANAEADALIAVAPHDPYFLEVKGQILLESGKPFEALAPLREATKATNYQPLIATSFGHALIATEDPANYLEAEKVLRQAVSRDYENPFAWYQLGTVYDLRGDKARAMLATAERASLSGDARTAAFSARAAMGALPQNSVDWIRAQDIAVASQNALDDSKGGRRR
ncbi:MULTISPECIES: M48 family metalloprotease [unclassified Sphingomonas]|uniref:M48 family metalloprotease n=1 Tax=unclassified Sphingomonas TaxID=196159 RepID=UPI000BD0F0C4|nr:MAG: peptidase M48 [Sphingomonas sp. 12-62-6]OYX38542.1 MAG: peptidase M48 [Sphingomonas sp. 32-62-10]